MVRGIIIPADNKAQLTAATFETPAVYDRAVDGWAEAVHIPHVGVTMHLNLKGSNRQLPYNRRATLLSWFYIPAARGEARILGDVVLAPGTYRVSTRERSQNRWHTEPIDRDDYLETVVWAALLQEISPTLEVRIERVDLPESGRNQP